jgi:hypothetical protein
MRWVLLLLVLASVLTFDYYSADWGRGEVQAIGTNTIEYQMEDLLVEVRQ